MEWAARRLDAPELADDAAELFARKAERVAGSPRAGRAAARRWYRRQALAAVGRALALRGGPRAGESAPDRGVRPGRAPWLAGLGIDAKLAVRMLVKYPGVSLVGGLAMAIGIGLGAGYLELVDDLLDPTLPFQQGDRIVAIRVWDLEADDPELRVAQDFVAWRDQLESVTDLGAFRSIERNLSAEAAGPAEPATGAEITPSAFGMLRVPALAGRPLVPSDARAGAAPVIVLGYDLWRVRFGSDPDVVGTSVRLGRMEATVVGVMPQGFAFPVSHDFWMPLPEEILRAAEARQGPPIQVFGRLAPGASLASAQAELAALAQRAAADAPSTHATLRPELMPYTELFIGQMTGGGGGTGMYLVELFFVVLLLVLASNVATMVFARTATRENEIAVRFALGSSRGRILGQFFLEAMLLASVAAVLALTVVGWGTTRMTRFVWDMTQGQQPFWLDGGLNPRTVLLAAALAVAGALVAGVVPAYKATGSHLQARIRDAAGAGASALRFGGFWSVMIVAQVALAVLIMPPAILSVWSLAEPGYVEPGFPGHEYLSAELSLDREAPAAVDRDAATMARVFEDTYRELERRLEAEPGVSAVTFATHLPVMNHPQPWIEVSGDDARPASWAMTTAVDAGFFEAFGAEIVAGRSFDRTDADTGARVVIVNEHFVEEFLGGRNAVGRRVRYTSRYGERATLGEPSGLPDAEMREPGDWFEIVGVVRGLGMDTNRDLFFPGHGPGVYHPLTPAATRAGGSHSLRVGVHVRGGGTDSFAPRLREIAQEAHPDLRLTDVLPLDGPVDRANRGERLVARFAAGITAFVAAIALLISVAGTYAALSFTVSRQTREIGIRIALGADRRRIVTGVFSRAMLQIALGIALGAGVWFYLVFFGIGGGDRLDLLFTTIALLVLVGLAGCGMPVWRALRIEPTEALREGG